LGHSHVSILIPGPKLSANDNRFHGTSDARIVLEKLEGREFHGVKLDVQVPERFRHDLSEREIHRRLSKEKPMYQNAVQAGLLPAGQIPLPPRSSFSRNNSIRKFRTNSLANSDGSGRRNSMFSPQDARSDLPGLPEIAEATSLPQYPPISETQECTLIQEDPLNAHDGPIVGSQAMANMTPSVRAQGSTGAPSELRYVRSK